METTRRRDLDAYLETHSNEHPNLEGYTWEEIWRLLPEQDARHGTTDGLRDMLNDIDYKD